MNIKNILFFFILCATAAAQPAKAAMDFNNYEPTLTKLNATINSGYSLFFSSVTTPSTNPKNYDFINYVLDASSSVTSTYYKINYSTITGSGPDLVRISSVSTGASPLGYFKNLNVTSTGGTESPYQTFSGGAVNNDNGVVMGDITADFIGNNITSAYTYNELFGGAIFNNGTIGNITGDFIGNYVWSTATSYYRPYGGAIYNAGVGAIGDIKGNFINNYASWGGAVYNAGTINKITGDFIANYTTVSDNYTSTRGGAIYNTGNITEGIEGNFIGNYSSAASNQAWGGAIFNNSGNIGNITGDFINNYVYSNYSAASNGGAINLYGGSLGNLTGNFIGNYVNSANNLGRGGAIYSSKPIGNIEGKFVENYVSARTTAQGGVIYNTGGSTGKVIADFIRNHVESITLDASGGALATGSTGSFGTGISSGQTAITGNFEGNYALSQSSGAYGGAIYTISIMFPTTSGIIGIRGNFTGNYVSGATIAHGGAIYNTNNFTYSSNSTAIIGNFERNYASAGTTAYGGAIYNTGNIGTNSTSRTNATGIIGNFTRNYAFANTTAYGGAIYNAGTIAAAPNSKGLIGDFEENYASAQTTAYGGAIYNTGTIGIATNGTAKGISGSFLNNYAVTTSGADSALGGAIYTTKDMLFSADGSTGTNIAAAIEFTGNYTKDSTGKTYNAIYISGARTISFNTLNSGTITINDNICGDGVEDAALNITGDGTGTLNLNAEAVYIKQINVTSSTLVLGTYNHGDATATNNITNGLFWKAEGDKDTPFTSLTLANAALSLKYNLTQNNGNYQNLIIDDLSLTGTNYLTFAANFGDTSQSNGYGLSDKITIENSVNGSINLRHIDITGDIAVGNKINLFGNLGVEISNVDTYSLIYGGKKYTFGQENSNKDFIVSEEDYTYVIYVSTGQTLDFQKTTLDNASDQGIIYNDGTTTVTGTNFTNNSNTDDTSKSSGDGGVIANYGGLTVVDSSFSGSESRGLGGAIYSESDITVQAGDNKNVTFANNKDKNGDNDIYMGAGTNLILEAGNQGNININSGLNGDSAGYTLTIAGNENGEININSTAKNVSAVIMNGGNFNAANPSDFNNINLALNGGNYEIGKNIIDDILINNLTGGGGSLWIDVDPDALTADIIKVSGDLSGSVQLTLNALSENQPADKILFAETLNDDPATDGEFKIYRVINSPYYNWTTEYDQNGKWYLPIQSNGNIIAPEAVAYTGLHTASIEQTRSMVSNIRSGAATNKVSPYSRYSVWANPIYFDSTIEDPVRVKSSIQGLEAGFDAQINQNHRPGIFVSYRNGGYDLNGKGKNIFSDTESEIDINSYIGGLYYHYNYNQLWVFATLYGGRQEADIKTDDGISSGTDGLQIGGSIETAYFLSLSGTLKLEPSLGISFTQVDFDDANNNHGVNAGYSIIRQAELEAGVKLEKYFLYKGMVYIKPSAVQVIADGNEVNITGLEKVSTYNDGTLGRVQTGGKYAFTRNLSTYGFINYTFGSSYNAVSLSVGLNYSW